MSFTLDTPLEAVQDQISTLQILQTKKAADSHSQDFDLFERAVIYQDDRVIIEWNPGYHQPQFFLREPIQSISGGHEVQSQAIDVRTVFKHVNPSTVNAHFFYPGDVFSKDWKWSSAWNRCTLWLNSDDDRTFPFYEIRVTTDGQWGYTQIAIVMRTANKC
jgi:hypothetical protein